MDNAKIRLDLIQLDDKVVHLKANGLTSMSVDCSGGHKIDILPVHSCPSLFALPCLLQRLATPSSTPQMANNSSSN